MPAEPPSRWVSVDGASRVSGVAIWSGLSLELVGVVRPKPARWCDEWRQVFNGCGALVLEGGYSGPNRQTDLKLARARGRIEGFAEALGLSVLPPLLASQWRSTVGVPGSTRKAQKQAARYMARWLATHPDERPRSETERWNSLHLPALAGAGEDEAEAALLGIATMKRAGWI